MKKRYYTFDSCDKETYLKIVSIMIDKGWRLTGMGVEDWKPGKLLVFIPSEKKLGYTTLRQTAKADPSTCFIKFTD